MQQAIAERVQIMAAQMVSPQTLKSRFWAREEREGSVRGAWGEGIPHILGLEDPRRRGMVGEEGRVEVGVHAHLEGPSGFIAGGVRGDFQFLP